MSFRPLRNSDSTSAISWMDPAIDKDRMDEAKLTEFAKRRIDDPSCYKDLVPFKDGEQPTVFTIGVIPVDTLVRINDECPPVDGRLTEQCRWRSFLHGVRDIANWPEKPKKRTINGLEYVDPEWLKSQFARGLKEVAMDVGAQVWRWNHLMESEVKN